jgi:3-oxoacyl-[acyl-carrier-protein] synthase-3
MQFENVAIASVAHVDAPDRVSSRSLEERLGPALSKLGLPPGALEALTGIAARRMWPEAVPPSQAATQAAEKALSIWGGDRARVGVLISTSVCRDFIEPSVACLVHGNLGLAPDCLNFDLANACLGFLNGMDIAAMMIERGQIDFGLVVDGENSRFVVEQTLDRLAANPSPAALRDEVATLTLGSGGAAMVLARKDLVDTGHRFVGGVTVAATEHNGLCRGQRDKMVTDTKGLQDAGTALAQRTWQKAHDELGWMPGDLDVHLMHQVSRPHLAKISQVLEIDDATIPKLYPELGNVGPAAVPIALSKAVEDGTVKAGSRVALMGIGSGLNCSMSEVVW